MNRGSRALPHTVPLISRTQLDVTDMFHGLFHPWLQTYFAVVGFASIGFQGRKTEELRGCALPRTTERLPDIYQPGRAIIRMLDTDLMHGHYATMCSTAPATSLALSQLQDRALKCSRTRHL